MSINLNPNAINLTPVAPSLEAKELDALIQLWLDDCATRLPAHTVEGYAVKIAYFRRWWAAVGPGQNWVIYPQSDFRKFIDSLEATGRKLDENPLAYNTRKDIARRLQQMFRWAMKRFYLTNDWSVEIPNPIGSAPLRKLPPIEALRKLMEAAKGFSMLRDRAILAILIGTGVRRAEAASVNVEDVQLDADLSGVIRVRAKRVKGREIHERLVAFDKYAGRHIAIWLDVLGTTSGPLFPSQRHDQNRLTGEGIYKIVKGLIAQAGLDGQIQGPHDLRRAFATYWAKNRRGEGHGHLLSKQLGHASYRMTAHYTIPDVEDIREVMVSPFALMEGKE